MAKKLESWKDVFRRQVASGKYWKHQYDFESRRFVDRSDAVYICKKAQADVYEDIIEHLTEMGGDSRIITELETRLEKHCEDDISALGMLNESE